MGIRRPLVGLAGVLLVVAAVVPAGAQEVDGRYREFGDPGGFLNIVPPGQTGHIPPSQGAGAAAGESTPPHFEDQLGSYAGLIREDATPGITEGELSAYFKDASFGVPDGETTAPYAPGGRGDVTVVRGAEDGVPHIFGETREGTMFAAGYTGAEDRLFLMDVLRHVGRAELVAFLGPSDGNKAQDASQLAAAPYTEEDLTAQIEQLRRSEDPVERQVYRDGLAYVEGVNTYIREIASDPEKLPAEYPALNRVPEEWVPEDIVAIASLVGGIFGKGGGREVANYCGLRQLEEATGSGEAARTIFEDLKFADDAEAPRTVPAGEFPYMTDPGQVDPATVPALDCASLEAIQAPPPDEPADFEGTVEDLVPEPPVGGAAGVAGIELPWGSLPLQLNGGLSNALLLGGEETATGEPLAVFGPQTGYFVPQLLVEKDIHGPGISARGVSFAGTDLYVQLGRGTDYAWSATSAGADLVDEFVLELCEPDGGEPTTQSMGYLHDGDCREIEAHQKVLLAKSSAGGLPVDSGDPDPGDVEQDDVLVNSYFERAPDYGPLTARGITREGTPVAVAEARTTYTEELRSARGFLQINDPEFMADGRESFQRAFRDGVDYTFNWFFVDERDISYQMSCKCPSRAPGTDPYLPTWGTGAHDWQGIVDRGRTLPATTNPDQGYLISWNNKQARGFRSNDGQFGWGPIHRSSLLEGRLRAVTGPDGVTIGEAVDVMALAGTTDLRAQELVPLLLEVMEDRAPADVDARTRAMLDQLAAWSADDLGHRRDHDGDGGYEHATAIAIMDAWWGGLETHPDARLFDAMFSERTFDARTALGLGVHDAPQNHLGSAFQDSLYAHVQKDLRQALGEEVTDPLSRTYCGGGDLTACADALWGSLAATGAALAEEFGSAAIDDWRRVPADDEIRHSAVSVGSVPPIDWQNRPTFQQVVQVGAAGEQDGAAPPPTAAPAPPSVATPATGGGGVAIILGLALVAAAVSGRRGRG